MLASLAVLFCAVLCYLLLVPEVCVAVPGCCRSVFVLVSNWNGRGAWQRHEPDMWRYLQRDWGGSQGSVRDISCHFEVPIVTEPTDGLFPLLVLLDPVGLGEKATMDPSLQAVVSMEAYQGLLCCSQMTLGAIASNPRLSVYVHTWTLPPVCRKSPAAEIAATTMKPTPHAMKQQHRNATNTRHTETCFCQIPPMSRRILPISCCLFFLRKRLNFEEKSTLPQN